MRKIRELLRLAQCGRSQCEIAIAVRTSMGRCGIKLQRAKAAQVAWDDAQQLTDEELDDLLFAKGSTQPSQRSPVNFVYVHQELHRVGVTLQLLWAEYQESAASRNDGTKPYQYSQFCELYRTSEGSPRNA